MKDTIYLGHHGIWGATHLTKHSWDCGWYWAFGYLGNSRCHWHMNSLIESPKECDDKWTDVNRHFSSTWMTSEIWWVLRDLFIQAYALKEAAKTYQVGGHQTEIAKPYRVLNQQRAADINADLKVVLDNIWTYLLTQRELHEARAGYRP